jgi:CheY-like chemotaxis protein
LTVRLHIPEEKDNEINLRLLVRYMRKLGVDYVTAVNGLEALNIYRASPD